MTVTINQEEIASIAGQCRTSSANIQEEASTMQAQMTKLESALQGVPNIALAERFQEWNALFRQLSQALDESNSYLNSVLNTVNEFIASLGRA